MPAKLLAPSIIISLGTAVAAAEGPLRVAAAVSLREVLTEVGAEFKAQTRSDVEFVFGSSGQMLAQVRHGADVDLFISAAPEQVEALEREGLIAPATRRVIAGNRLVLVTHPEEKLPPTGFRTLADPHVAKIAIGEPVTVPAGQYAMQVLTALKLEEALRGRLVYGMNVRQVLDYVQRGEVTAGMVYASDALTAGERVRVVETADLAWHQPIEYHAALLKSTRQPQQAARWLDFLGSESSRRAFIRLGFWMAPQAQQAPPATPEPAFSGPAGSGP